MDAATIGIIVAAVFGGGGIASVLQGLSDRRKSAGDVWRDVTDRLDKDIHRLEQAEEAQRQTISDLEMRVRVLEAALRHARTQNRQLAALLIEHRIPVPPDATTDADDG